MFLLENKGFLIISKQFLTKLQALTFVCIKTYGFILPETLSKFRYSTQVETRFLGLTPCPCYKWNPEFDSCLLHPLLETDFKNLPPIKKVFITLMLVHIRQVAFWHLQEFMKLCGKFPLNHRTFVVNCDTSKSPWPMMWFTQGWSVWTPWPPQRDV